MVSGWIEKNKGTQRTESLGFQHATFLATNGNEKIHRTGGFSVYTGQNRKQGKLNQ
jgi:hypothetical protein